MFELAARGFQTICDRYSKLFESKNHMSPLVWLEYIVSEICAGTGEFILLLLCYSLRLKENTEELTGWDRHLISRASNVIKNFLVDKRSTVLGHFLRCKFINIWSQFSDEIRC